MGATDFQTIAFGKTVDEAFQNAIKEAQYLHGHEGYTGTIAEKNAFRLIDYPVKNAGLAARMLMDAEDYPDDIPERFRQWAVDNGGNLDKWGPCIAMKMKPKQEKELREARGLKGKRGAFYLFCGIASC